jgi:hypothetical protein
MTDVIADGALDDLPRRGRFEELSWSRMGGLGNRGTAEMVFDEPRKRRLARPSEDGASIPMHGMVRSRYVVLLADPRSLLGPNARAAAGVVVFQCQRCMGLAGRSSESEIAGSADGAAAVRTMIAVAPLRHWRATVAYRQSPTGAALHRSWAMTARCWSRLRLRTAVERAPADACVSPWHCNVRRAGAAPASRRKPDEQSRGLLPVVPSERPRCAHSDARSRT